MDGESWPVKKLNENGLGVSSPLSASFQFPLAFEDCGALPFEPSIKLKPSKTSASTPTGLEVDVHVPQPSATDAEALAESAVKATTVTLPEGVQLSPSAADGLESCSEGQIGYQGTGGTDPYSPSPNQTPEPLRFNSDPVNCPNASKVGIVNIKTPDLPNEIEGGVYLAQQNANPFGSLFAMYIIAEDPISRVTVKLAGEVRLNPSTGQMTTSSRTRRSCRSKTEARTVRRSACVDLDAGELRQLHDERVVRALVGQPCHGSLGQVRDHLGRRRLRLREPAAVGSGLPGRLHEQAGRRIHAV